MPDAFRRDAVVLLGGVAGVALAVDLLRRIPHVNSTTVALVLLLIVLATATFARLRVAVLTSVVSMLAFNFFFIQPVGSFFVADAQNWVVLGVFVAVAVVASQLSASAQERARARLAETLLASMSHDMRTPLTATRIAVENLRGPLSEDERETQSHAAQVELERLSLLVENMLDMASIDAGAVKVDRQWVTAADIVDAAVAHVRHTLDGRRVRVDADGEREAHVDPRLVSSALSHVLENAARYSAAGGDIVVAGRVATDGLHVSVTDQGPGLDPAEIERLFDRFYRGQTARPSTHGTGMGLTIARGLLDAAGGSVRAENVAGSGARFSLSVPAPVRGVTALE
ncbi:MAG TPA: ATP-binding protein [Vicinamibacterales bacterium]|nr:ATP-binding protein [Vicinamibacterales bacterium]